jgi:hypothetical protein
VALGLVALVAALVVAGVGVLARARNVQRRAAADEARAVARLRLLVAAELRYGAANGGAFDTLGCLVRPSACLPRLRQEAHAFVEPRLVEPGALAGYQLFFHPGPPPHEPVDVARRSRTSLAAFAVVAWPDEEGRATRRGFCADSTLKVCVLGSREAPELQDGVCPLLCTDLAPSAKVP